MVKDKDFTMALKNRGARAPHALTTERLCIHK